MKSILLIIISVLSTQAFSQNLLNERIRKLSGRKKSIYLDQGIFHSGDAKTQARLKAVRHSFSKRNGYERLVMDFDGKLTPKIYGYISKNQKKIYMDLFNTNINPQIGSFGKSKFVNALNFFKFSDDSTSVEINLKKVASVDIFNLTNPGRIVIDIKP